jgi:putative endonuclease
MNKYFIYILASKRNWTLYIWVTNDIIRRIYEHKNKLVDWFTKENNVNKLVHYEEYNDINIALQREKNLKTWNRKWKIELIEKLNPNWEDLYFKII